jgi:signal transduction histidine kinase
VFGSTSRQTEASLTRTEERLQDFLVTWYQHRASDPGPGTEVLWDRCRADMADILASSVWAPLETLKRLPPGTRDSLEQGWRRALANPASPAETLVGLCLDLQVRLRDLGAQQREVADFLRVVLGLSFVTLAGGMALLGWFQVRQKETSRQLQQIYRASLVAVEEERKSLSRDLHDTVAQDLAAAKIRLSHLAVPGEHLGAILADLDSALGQVRQMAVGLRPPSLDRIGFSASLRELCQTVSRRAPLEVRFDIPPSTDGPVDEEVALHLYRIAQEALQNALRHSSGHRVDLVLTRTARKLVLEVGDDGMGQKVARPGTGLGLVGMGERAGLIGARLTIESLPGSGTKIRVEVPLEPTDRR